MTTVDEKQEYDRYFIQYCTVDPAKTLWEISSEVEKDLNFTAETKDATLISTHMITNGASVALMTIWERD